MAIFLSLLKYCTRQLYTLFFTINGTTFSMQRKPWPVAEWKFYVAFSLFRGASIYAGVYNRWTMVYFQMLYIHIY